MKNIRHFTTKKPPITDNCMILALSTMSLIGPKFDLLNFISAVTEPPTPIETGGTGSVAKCPKADVYGKPPLANCTLPTDPNNLPASALEEWFTKEMFKVGIFGRKFKNTTIKRTGKREKGKKTN